MSRLIAPILLVATRVYFDAFSIYFEGISIEIKDV